jgi:hypothetical protein
VVGSFGDLGNDEGATLLDFVGHMQKGFHVLPRSGSYDLSNSWTKMSPMIPSTHKRPGRYALRRQTAGNTL